MTETLQGTTPSRPIRSVVMQQRWVVLGGLAAAIGFFLPWVKTWLDFGPEISSNSGFSFSTTTESASSGNSLAILWIVLIAAAMLVAFGLYAAFVRLEARSYRWLSGLQAVLAIAGVAVIWVTLPSEIDTWSGLVVEYQPGIWVTTVGLAVGAIAALFGAANRDV